MELGNSILDTKEERLGLFFKTPNLFEARLWAPNVVEVSLQIYSKNDSNILIFSKLLKKNKDGVWEGEGRVSETNKESLDGCFYDYLITHKDGTIKHGLDPYSKSMASFTPSEDYVSMGLGVIVSLDSPRAGEKPKRIGKDRDLKEVPLVIYETHVRDFTIGLDIEGTGTFKGFSNYKEGIDHLVELGITHVQLLPIQQYYTVDEKEKGYTTCNNHTSYNWGYDPHNYFTIEGWLSSDDRDPYSRIREFRGLVNELHKNGIGVIMDVVYNHTYKEETFEDISPGSYFRMIDGKISGGTGAGSTLETRNPMVRKLIIDSLSYFVEEFGIDGFRFDLMGFLDIETMKKIREKLGEDVILYGEAWDFTDLPKEEAPIKGAIETYPYDLNIGFFNDSTRDSYFEFSLGNYNYIDQCKAGIVGNLIDFPGLKEEKKYHRFAKSPKDNIQYLSVHDGFTLWDRINLSLDGSVETRKNLNKFLMGMLLTSQGEVLLQGGSEIGTTKPAGKILEKDDPNRSKAFTSKLLNIDEDFEGVKYFYKNSYSSSDYVNRIKWERKKNPLFLDLFNYVKGLITLRKNNIAFRYPTGDLVRQGLNFILEDYEGNDKFIAYTLDNSLGDKKDPSKYSKFIVIHNGNRENLEIFNDMFIENLDILVDSERAGKTPLKESKIKLEEGRIEVTPLTTVVLGIK